LREKYKQMKRAWQNFATQKDHYRASYIEYPRSDPYGTLKINNYNEMKKYHLVFIILFGVHLFLNSCSNSNEKTYREDLTFTNPLNLNYRFDIDQPSHRTAADPVIILFKGEYYLFASKAGGYWTSEDLKNWDLVETPDLPLENYAPAAIAINDTVYFMANSHKLADGTYSTQAIYKTPDPKSGKWEIANPEFPFIASDPAFFQDDDGKLFLYFGLGRNGPIKGVELDLKNNLNPAGEVFECLVGNSTEYGWERRGDYNEQPDPPFIEGAWMTKYQEKYYLQYAAPGTQFKGYADGVYISESPTGPFVYAENNPFSIKPEGFVNGAGHGCTFQDKYGNWWHVATTVVAVRHHWERRIGLFPAGFDADGQLYSPTGFAGYPLIIPQEKVKSPEELFSGWMLLSYNKPFEVSSTLEDNPGSNAFDENIKTYWSAESGKRGEFIQLDLEKTQEIEAIQVNYAEHGTKIFGRDTADYHQYMLLSSEDGKNWDVAADKTENRSCIPHDYIQLEKTLKARFLKLVNHHIPDGTFALSGFRVFGKGNGEKPEPIHEVTVKRNKSDRREVEIFWTESKNATGYLVRFGNHREKLYQSQIVYGSSFVKIRRLNAKQNYFFTVDAFNENGVARGEKIFD
jgi:xylan 1,4-beta-xylosidase